MALTHGNGHTMQPLLLVHWKLILNGDESFAHLAHTKEADEDRYVHACDDLPQNIATDQRAKKQCKAASYGGLGPGLGFWIPIQRDLGEKTMAIAN